MSADISDFLNPELLAFTPAATGSGSSSSRESSPDSSWTLNQFLSTPPDAGYAFPSFSPPPTTLSGELDTTGLFSFLNEPSSFVKLPPNPTDIFSSNGFDWLDTGFGGGGSQTIDPQLVAKTTTASAPKTVEEKNNEEEELTLTINPVKVAGHGKARKGTVQSGGVSKKTSPAASFAAATSPTSSTSSSKENKKATTKEEMGDDDDMEDWRPSPEVLAKMTSKEKRQLRNKISARNFRVRRKEYITTLEMDIAERDRLLQAIRTELGSTQSENVALRTEIEALKKALLGGSNTSEDVPTFNLPPPAPLPTLSPQLSSTSPSSLLFSPNMQKDVSLTSAFWGGFPSSTASPSLLFGGGVTPVHTTIIPELSGLARNVNSPAKPNENINPVLNYINSSSTTGGFNKNGTAGFDGFADSNPFTMKTLDAYRMQLWTRLAQQNQIQPQPLLHHSPGSPSSSSSSSGSSKGSPTSSSSPPLISSPSMFTQPLPGGLAGSLRPSFFTNSSKINLVPSKTSPKPPTKAFSTKDTETAYIASLASQTLFKKLGGAFWDAFSGGASAKTVDADKVRKVLEGKAVVKVVDVEPATTTPKIPVASTSATEKPHRHISMSLEESMCRLSLTGLKGR